MHRPFFNWRRSCNNTWSSSSSALSLITIVIVIVTGIIICICVCNCVLYLYLYLILAKLRPFPAHWSFLPDQPPQRPHANNQLEFYKTKISSFEKKQDRNFFNSSAVGEDILLYKLIGAKDASPHLSLIDLKMLPEDLTMLPAFQFLAGPWFDFVFFSVFVFFCTWYDSVLCLCLCFCSLSFSLYLSLSFSLSLCLLHLAGLRFSENWDDDREEVRFFARLLPRALQARGMNIWKTFLGDLSFAKILFPVCPGNPVGPSGAESEDSESLRKPPPETSLSSDWQVEDDSPCPFSRLQTNLFSWFVLCETNGNVRTFSADLINFGKCRFYREVRTRFTTFVKTGRGDLSQDFRLKSDTNLDSLVCLSALYSPLRLPPGSAPEEKSPLESKSSAPE